MAYKLDKYDFKILHELDKNSRSPASEIAKKARLSKVSVSQRIRRLQKEGVIKSFMTQVDYRKLGYNICHVFYKLQNISSANEESFYSFLSKHNLIGYAARIDGNFDTYLVVIYQSNEQLDEALTEINNKFGQFIKERNILPVVHAQYFGRRYLAKEKEQAIEPVIRGKPKEIIGLDEISHKILQVLSQNARLPIIDLAEKSGITKDIAHYRIKKLAKEGILQKFTINLGHEKFGNSFFKILVTLNYNANEKEFLSRISAYKNLIRAIRLLGQWGIELDFEVENNFEMRKILKEIKATFGEYIQSVDSLSIYQIDKLNYYPL